MEGEIVRDSGKPGKLDTLDDSVVLSKLALIVGPTSLPSTQRQYKNTDNYSTTQEAKRAVDSKKVLLIDEITVEYDTNSG